MSSAARLIIELDGRDKTGGVLQRVNRDLGDVGKTAAGFALGSLGVQSITAGLGTVTRMMDEMGQAASRLEQSVGGTQAVFGDTAHVIDEFASRSAEAVGLSESAFRDMTTLVGGQLKRMTGDVDLAAQSSIRLTEVAADLAATYGGTTAEAMDAFAAALRGEADPAERFNLNLKISAVNAKAVELGLAKTTSAVDDNARAQALLALITEQSADALGQFAREADTHAVKTQKVEARAEDLRAEIGEKMLPAMIAWKELQLELIDLLSDEFVPILITTTNTIITLRSWLGADIDIPLIGKAVTLADVLVEAAKSAIPLLRVIDILDDFGLLSSGGSGNGSEFTSGARAAQADGLTAIGGTLTPMNQGGGAWGDSLAGQIFGMIVTPVQRAGEALQEPYEAYMDTIEDATGSLSDMDDSLKELEKQAKILDNVLENLGQAARDVFSRPTREEAEARLRIAEVDRMIASIEAAAPPGGGAAVDAALEPLEMLRDRLTSELKFMESQNEVQQLHLLLADQTLLTENEQNNAVRELIPLIRDQSEWVRRGNESWQSLVPAMATFISQLREFGSAVGYGSPQFTAAVASSVRQTVQSGGFVGVLN